MSESGGVRVFKKRELILYAGFKPEGAPDFTTVEYILKSDFDKLQSENQGLRESLDKIINALDELYGKEFPRGSFFD